MCQHSYMSQLFLFSLPFSPSPPLLSLSLLSLIPHSPPLLPFLCLPLPPSTLLLLSFSSFPPSEGESSSRPSVDVTAGVREGELNVYHQGGCQGGQEEGVVYGHVSVCVCVCVCVCVWWL